MFVSRNIQDKIGVYQQLISKPDNVSHIYYRYLTTTGHKVLRASAMNTYREVYEVDIEVHKKVFLKKTDWRDDS
jgi:hypothetical protein